MNDSLYPFLGAAVGAVVSAYFWQLARREGHRPLMWTMGLATGVFFVAALFFGSQV
jgi:integral membrane sensor domain MASE1